MGSSRFRCSYSEAPTRNPIRKQADVLLMSPFGLLKSLPRVPRIIGAAAPSWARTSSKRGLVN